MYNIGPLDYDNSYNSPTCFVTSFWKTVLSSAIGVLSLKNSPNRPNHIGTFQANEISQ